ncbi:MAG: hypothetical protein IKG77_03760, partial [Prevotella sp.]|nr:hypothetical protein [Prevotella sp.]
MNDKELSRKYSNMNVITSYFAEETKGQMVTHDVWFLERHAVGLGEWLGGKGQRVLKKSHVRFFSGKASR